MEPDRSKQQQHTTARHRKLLLSNRMNENLCVCYVLNNFFISSFERNPFLFYITPEGFFFCFKLFTFFFFTGLWPRSFVLSLWLFDVNIVPRAPAGGPGSFGVNLLLLLSSIRCVARKPSPSFTSILSIKRKKQGNHNDLTRPSMPRVNAQIWNQKTTRVFMIVKEPLNVKSNQCKILGDKFTL